MDRRFVLFLALSLAFLMVNNAIWNRLNPPKPAAQNAAKQVAEKKPEIENGSDKKDVAKVQEADKKADAEPPAEKSLEVAANQAEENEPELQWFTLGSVDPSDQNPYRGLWTITNRGAAVERMELASERYRDLDDRTGYLGNLALSDTAEGPRVSVVGPGTPAAAAGLQAGDIIQSIDGEAVQDAKALVKELLGKTVPGQSIEVGVLRAGQPQKLTAQLSRHPLEVIRPEVLEMGANIPTRLDVVEPGDHDPYSFLLTLRQIDDKKLKGDELETELPGVKLRASHWTGKQVDPDTVEFTRPLPQYGLEVVKRYHIAKHAPNQPAYHVTLDVELRNVGQTPREVAYQLDGPTGLPVEGWWYNSRPSPNGTFFPTANGVRNVAALLQSNAPAVFTPMQIESEEVVPLTENPSLLTYAGVDAQYFASAVLPNPQVDRPFWLAEISPILVGRLPADSRYKLLGDVTCRLVSMKKTLAPGGDPLKHTYTVFAGPKQPELLAQYGTHGDNLGKLIYYGWPIWAFFARLLTAVLHEFYRFVGNYGVAIVMLTVCVRACMFPLSRKQALAAQKMQELKPEMDKINEKYKGKAEEKTRAMQELWRKHNYNPMSGCMMAFVQLPIFLGLYRALMVDVELRQAPLLGEAIHWCSNLAAPDMLLDWSGFMPKFVTAYRGFGSLGPYLNILPLITVALFIWQQKMFMPPATDDQTRMQQKMMKYMMVLMAFMFYTVPSGLCIYFIASSLWGIAERKVLPKTIGGASPKATGGGSAISKLLGKSTPTNGASVAEARRERRKQRGGK
ncbi:MAG: YidC/Oxa1 family insertase periplasmic-domain containing protein [Pirellulales bacterium]|nr:YidC/Oxa1 family insertase periplasmic-domain containing protein [Pirellulales bacterium]